jgi:hypothetical protein
MSSEKHKKNAARSQSSQSEVEGATQPREAAELEIKFFDKELCSLQAAVEDLKALVKEVFDVIMGHQPQKEFYTIQEAAVLLNREPYTVREWCRLGRVNGVKAHCGRGADNEWRISHAEIIRIQNEGLLPPPGDVPPPPRMGKPRHENRR